MSKRNQISDLINLAHVDDKLTDDEYNFIRLVAERMEFPLDELEELFKHPLPSKPLLSELERITHFYNLILLMNVDRETHYKEVIAIRNFGLKMGIRPGVTDQILIQMEDYKDKIIPSADLIKIFQTYYN